MIRPARRSQQGVALVTTVIVVAMLAVVGVALMQSTGIDRATSRSVANNLRARLAAEAGASASQAFLADLVRLYPDSTTVWQNIGSGAVNGTNNEATVLYLRALAGTNRGASPGQFGSAISLQGQPLVSRVGSTPESLNLNPVPLGGLASLLPYSSNNPSMVNINATNSSRPEPFVGFRSSTNPGAPVTAAQWIYLTRDGGPTNATNPYVARYAFWVEDESFKVNVNVVTNGPRGAQDVLTNGGFPSLARLDGSWRSSADSQLTGAQFSAVIADRGTNGFPTVLTAAFPAGVNDPISTSELRFLTTTVSAGLDVTRGGVKRFNLNSLTNGIARPTDVVPIRAALSRVAAAITNTNAAPLFGQRFYGRTNAASANLTNAVTAPHAAIYLQKIAANLLDYVDSNDQPTIIDNDPPNFSIRAGKPAYGIEALGGGLDGTNSVAAMGIENLPRLQEYAIHARLRSMRTDPSDPNSFGFVFNPGGNNPSSAAYEIWIDHYFEFWNPGTRDITLTNAFLKIYDQPRFGNSITGALATENRETTEIPLNNITFPAGRCIVLTTAKPGEISAAANATVNGFALIDTTRLTSPGDVVSLNVPDADRKFNGTTADIKTHTYNSVGSYGPSIFGTNAVPYNRLFQVDLRPRSTGVTDYRSAFVLGSNDGILESFVGLPIAWSQTGPALSLCVSNGYIRDGMANVGSLGAGNNDNVRGGSLRGNGTNNSPVSTEGDPRALNEQMSFLNYGPSANLDQTRFYVTISGGAPLLPDGSSVGVANSNFVFPGKWVDFSSTAAGMSNAPLFVRNGALESIGEMGHLTDPARAVGTGGVTLSRGGGRTLRVGQPELPAWFDGNQTNASRTWTSWRLADVFSASTNTNSLATLGLINPNGALRDKGAALQAALFGVRFQSAADGLGAIGLDGKEAILANVVTNVLGRLTNATGKGVPAGALNPFWERGEFSELGLFSGGTALASGVNMSNVFDRGREELVRRSIEMITPRGSVFTAYVVGQSLQVQPGVTNVLATAQLKSTFELIPQFPAGATNDLFDPTPAGITSRFQAATNYQIRVLSAFYE